MCKMQSSNGVRKWQGETVRTGVFINTDEALRIAGNASYFYWMLLNGRVHGRTVTTQECFGHAPVDTDHDSSYSISHNHLEYTT